MLKEMSTPKAWKTGGKTWDGKGVFVCKCVLKMKSYLALCLSLPPSCFFFLYCPDALFNKFTQHRYHSCGADSER